MKKIISFAMAAMLVLAFAVPVFAVSGVTIPTNPTPKYDAKLAITPVQNQPSTDGNAVVITPGVQYYPLPANYHVVKDTIVTFAIQYSIPAKGEINYNGYIDNDNLALELTLKNLYNVVVEYAVDGKGNTIASEIDPKGTSVLFGVDFNSEGLIIIEALVKANADVKVVGEISFGDYTLEDGAVTADGKYTIWAGKDSYWMIDKVGNKVEFFYNAKKECVRIEVTAANGHAVDKSPWLVVCKEFHGAAFTFGFCPVANEATLLTNTITEGAAFNELNAIFTAAMDYMGFKLGAGGQIWDALFMAKIGAFCLAKDAVLLNCTENGGNNGGGKPPKTGDVASIMGFVMLAAAAVPAGVASFRKVRK